MSAGNLAAVLGSLRCVELYDGPAAYVAQLSGSVDGFSRIYVEISPVRSGNAFCVGSFPPSKMISGGSAGFLRYGSTVSISISFAPQPSGTVAAIDEDDIDSYGITKVIGIRD